MNYLSNDMDEVLLRWERESMASYDFSNRELSEIFPEAGTIIETNIRRLQTEIIEERRRYLSIFTKVREKLKESPVGLILAKFLYWDSPVLSQTKRLAELKALQRFYTPRSEGFGSLTEANVVRAKSHLISDFITVPRSGMVRCPFHQEKTASCKVYGNRFHCFGCGEHGDVIDWVMKTENRDFKSAVQSLQ